MHRSLERKAMRKNPKGHDLMLENLSDDELQTYNARDLELIQKIRGYNIASRVWRTAIQCSFLMRQNEQVMRQNTAILKLLQNKPKD
jgi:hypothetical protein